MLFSAKFIFVSLIVVFKFNQLFACSCSTPVLNQQYINSTPYIALIKIKNIVPGSAKGTTANSSYLIDVEELQHFKGVIARQISVYGYHQSLTPNNWSSCDMDVQPNQEWIIFATIDSSGVPGFSMCTNSVLYRNQSGLRNWAFKQGFSQLHMLNNHFNTKSPASVLPQNTQAEYYSNGQPEFVIGYKKGKKDGIATYYFPDGSVYGKINFKDDSLHGKSVWYYANGSVMQQDKYRNGKKVDTSIYFAGRDIILYRSIYDKRGNLLVSEFYQGLKNRFLYEQTFYKKGKRVNSVHRNEDGKVSNVAYYYPNNYHTQREEEYDTTGKLIKKKYWDENGKFIRVENF